MEKRRRSPVRKEHIEAEMCSREMAHAIVAGLPFFEALPEKAVTEAAVAFRDYGFRPQEQIYRVGTAAERLYVVAAGTVELVQYGEAGDFILLDILGKGEFFGTLSLAEDERYRETAIAHSECCVLAIGTGRFRRFAGTWPQVALSVIDILSKRMRELENRVRSLSSYPVDRRIGLVLLTLARKFGEAGPDGVLIQLRITREEIAALAGTTLETASRTLSMLREEGIIESGRGWIRLEQPERLEGWNHPDFD